MAEKILASQQGLNASSVDAQSVRAKLASGGNAVGWKDLGKREPSPYQVAQRAIADAHRLAASIEGVDGAVDTALAELIAKLCDLRGDLERAAALAGELADLPSTGATTALVGYSVGDEVEATGLASQGDSGKGKIVSVCSHGFIAECEDGERRGAAWADINHHYGAPVAMLV